MTIQEKFQLYKQASIAYYNGEDTLMSDYSFDKLEEELLNSEDREIIQFIKNSIQSNQDFVRASGMQVSLKKIKYKDDNQVLQELINFFGNKPGKYMIGPKFDGCGLRINNKTKVIQTRGGQNVTEKLEKLNSVEQSINQFNNCENIVGELIIKKSLFNKKYSDEFSNSRNLVGGMLNQKSDKNSDKYYDLDFIPCTDGTNPINDIWKNFDVREFDIEIIKYIKYLYNSIYKTDNFDYLCDGIVIAYNTDKRIIKDNYPLNMVAIKFPGEVAKSTVTSIEWTQKKSNRLTPIIHFLPVKLLDTTVTKCSGYNYEYLLNNGIATGSFISITKSGDIIPIHVETINRKLLSEVDFPKVWFEIIGKHLVTNDLSEDQIISKFINAFNKLDIKGLGPEACKKIGEVCNFDIVEMFNPKLQRNFIAMLDFNSAVYKNFSKIHDITTLYLSDLIYMLQFENCGEKLSQIFEDIFYKKEGASLSNVNREVAEYVLRGEGSQIIKESIKKLNNYGINIIKHLDVTNTITFEMTGEPPKEFGSKSDFVKLLQSKYGHDKIQHTTLTKTTNYLLCDDLSSNSGKMTKARKYNVNIITYHNFIKKIDSNSTH